MADVASDCRGFEADLSALLDDELTPERAAEVRAHAGACENCRGRLARLERVDAILSRAPAPALPASLRTRLEARVEGARAEVISLRPPPRMGAPRRARRGRAAVALAAAAAGVAFYLAVATREPARGPQLEPLPEWDLALELESVEDLDVIANLELLELVLAADAS